MHTFAPKHSRNPKNEPVHNSPSTHFPFLTWPPEQIKGDMNPRGVLCFSVSPGKLTEAEVRKLTALYLHLYFMHVYVEKYNQPAE